MGRRKTIANEQILKAARSLFMEQGYQASTSTIAKKAGVSEGTIFNRFPTKEALFLAAMNLPDIDIAKVVESHLENPEARAGLSALIEDVLNYFRVFMPRIMMLTFSHPSSDGIPAFREHKRAHVTRILVGIATYFKQEIERGRISSSNPEICARILLGSILNFVISQRIGIHLDGPLEPKKFIEDLVTVLWNGMGANK